MNSSGHDYREEFLFDEEYFDGPRRPSIMAANAAYLVAAIGIIVIPLIARVAMHFWTDLDVYVLDRNASVLYEMLFLLLPVMLYRGSHEGVEVTMRMRLPKISAVLIAAAAGIVGLFLTNYLGMLWWILIESMGGYLSESSLVIGGGEWGMLSAILTIALLPAVCEELLFRGMMLGAWERRGTTRALCVTSLLFALLHGSVQGFPIHVMLGFIIGYLTINSGSIYVGMTYHLVHNAGIVLLSSMQGATERSMDTLYVQIGGAAGVAITALHALIAAVIMGVILVWASSDREMRGFRFERPGPVDRGAVDWRDTVVLVAAIVTAGAMMFMDLLACMGVI